LVIPITASKRNKFITPAVIFNHFGDVFIPPKAITDEIIVPANIARPRSI